MIRGKDRALEIIVLTEKGTVFKSDYKMLLLQDKWLSMTCDLCTVDLHTKPGSL